jgi:hypothetical protein
VDIAKSVETEQMMSGEFPPVFDTQSSKATDELPETFDDLPF